MERAVVMLVSYYACWARWFKRVGIFRGFTKQSPHDSIDLLFSAHSSLAFGSACSVAPCFIKAP
jgi:hypothetical protein